MQLGGKDAEDIKNHEMVQYECFNNIQPASGLMIFVVYDPPVSPKANHIKLFQSFSAGPT
jgi:hypothetical protein